MLIETFDDNTKIPPLESVFTRDAIGVFRNLISARNERVAGFSFLKYVNTLLNGDNARDLPAPSSGFFEDLIKMVLNWRHSGFNVFCGQRIQPGDEKAMENLARYIVRASLRRG